MKTKFIKSPMLIEHILNFVLPQSKAELIMSIIDSSGISMWFLMEKGTIHNLDAGMEFGIKSLTLLSLALTVIYKFKKIKKR